MKHHVSDDEEHKCYNNSYRETKVDFAANSENLQLNQGTVLNGNLQLFSFRLEVCS